MKQNIPIRMLAVPVFVFGALTGWAIECVSFVVDNGGLRSTNAMATYCNDGSIGAIGGFSSGGETIALHGYIGQMTETRTLAVTSATAQINEAATTQLSGAAMMDDGSLTVLAGSEIVWNSTAWPLVGIDAGGLATASAVYSNTHAAVKGQYLGVEGGGSLMVLDSEPDNYGSYAADGLPDSWQNLYFGLDNSDAAPDADASGTGQNNLFKYVAGLDPTNSASRFMLNILTVTGQPGKKQIIFSPRWSDRTYTPLFSTNLVSGAGFTELSAITTADNGAERTVTDTNATAKAKFYRVRITLP